MWVWTVVLAGIVAQAASDPAAVLARCRGQLLARLEHQPNYICRQSVDRSYFIPRDSRPREHRCDGGPAKLSLLLTDRLRLDVKVSEGREIASWPDSKGFDDMDIVEMTGGGPFGTGPLGTMLQDIFDNSAGGFNFLGEKKLQQDRLFRYRFRVPEESSHYVVRAGQRWIPTSYTGELWIRPDSAELARLIVHTSELQKETGACFADTIVDYQLVQMTRELALLPKSSDLHFVMRGGAENESHTSYSNCHEYLGESTIYFEGAPEINSHEPAGRRPAGTLAEGLPLVLRLSAPIETRTAAAGDVVLATLAEAVLQVNGPVIPAGTVVRGRITQMRHWLRGDTRFEISIRLQEMQGLAMRAGPATLLFRTARKDYVVRPGYELRLTTVKP